MKVSLYLKIVLLTITLAIVSCSVITNPASVAKDWFTAVSSMDALKADKLVCNSQKEKFRSQMALGSIFLRIGNSILGDSKIEVDISGINFTIEERKNNSSVVHAFGELRGAVGGVVESQSIDEKWNMVYENNEWLWCGTQKDQAIQSEPLVTKVTQTQSPINIEKSDQGLTGRIIFAGSIDSNTLNTYISDPDGSNLVKIGSQDIKTEGGGNSGGIYYWSPYGDKVAVQDSVLGKNYIVDRDGSNLKEFLFETDKTYILSWSHSGKKVVILRILEDNKRKLFVCDNQATNCQNVTLDDEEVVGSSESISWSSIDNSMAYINSKRSKVIIVNTDTNSVEHIITYNGEDQFSRVELSPNNDKVAILTFSDQGGQKIQVYSKDGVMKSELSDFKNYGLNDIFTNAANFPRDPKWLDNNNISFRYGGDLEVEELIYNTNNGELSSITNKLYISDPKVDVDILSIRYLQFIKDHPQVKDAWFNGCFNSPNKDHVIVFSRDFKVRIIGFPSLEEEVNLNHAAGMVKIFMPCWSPK